MKDVKFMIPYEECINERETVKMMKKHLLFLAKYVDRDYIQNGNVLNRIVEEESELIDFLPYTKSITKVTKKSSGKAQSKRLLDAMEMYEREKIRKAEQRKERAMRCAWLLEGIDHLQARHKKILLLKYVHKIDNDKLCIRLGNISLSTLNRHLSLACIELAKLLELEIMKAAK